MEDIEQTNKKHIQASSGRKFRENKKTKLNELNKVDYKDSRGQSFVKTKKKVDKVNEKAFAIQNINKAKKKVALVVDRQTSKHTFHTLSDSYLNAPQLIVFAGPKNSGKSTLLRTLMRHYTGSRKSIVGPATVVTSKTKRVTFLECPNDLHSQIDISKTADMILLMVNVKQGLQTETLEFIELLTVHGVPRVKIIFTHIDEFPKHDKKMQAKIKLITKRIQDEIHALPYRLSEIKTFRKAGNSEYKIEEVKNLARLIGQKLPRPNDWRSNHPYIIVDRLEKVNKNQLNSERPEKNADDFHEMKFYGYVRGSTMSSTIPRMHLMGVDDLVIDSVTPLNEPCPTPMQESGLAKKRQPLAIKERKAYAPMSGYGGVLKDTDGFHIVSDSCDLNDKTKTKKRSDHSSEDESENDENKEINNVPKSSLIKDLESSDEDESDNDSAEESGEIIGEKRKLTESDDDSSLPLSKKRCFGLDNEDSGKLVSGFEDLQDELKTENHRINYERLVYDDDYSYNLNVLDKLQNNEKDLSIDLFVTGKWDPNEDAATLLKRDEVARNKLNKKNNSDTESEDEMENEEIENIDDEDEEMEIDDEDEEIENDDDDEEIENDDDDEEMENEEDIEDGNKIDSDEEYEQESEMESDEDDEDNNDKQAKKSTDIFEGLTPDTAGLSEFKKKMLLKESKTKREKKLEKKAKHKALFDNLYDQKSGETAKSSFFDKWKENNDEQERKNKTAFEHLDQEDAYKITGLKPGTYVCVVIKKVPREFYENFNPKRPIILGGLATGEESYAILTASFKLCRHFNIKQVLKTEDPLCMSIGWRRIQSFCYFFKVADNGRNTYRKYSEQKGLYCMVAFRAPVVPVKTGFAAFLNFEHHENFRVTGIGSILSKNDSVDIKKKLKRLGEPAKIFNKTAFIKNMFSSELEVIQYANSLIKTASGIRGAVKKPVKDAGCGPGTFRATFEAQISMADVVFLTSYVSVDMMKGCQNIQNLLCKPDEVFPYWKLWNQYYRDNDIELPAQKPDSKYKKITRQPFVAPPIKLNKKIIEKLPFVNRPKEDELEDLFQKNRPQVVLDAQESRKAQLVDSLLNTNEERRNKHLLEKQKYSNKKRKQIQVQEEKDLEKKKKKSKVFFKVKSLRAGEAKRKPAKK